MALTGIRRSIAMLINQRGIDSNIARHVRTGADKCFWCGADLNGNGKSGGVHIDHVVPRSKSGGDRLSNIVASCPGCNMKKHAKNPLDFAREVGADAEKVKKIVENHQPGKAKQITVFHLDRYNLDAFIFRGYNERMIEDVKSSVSVRFYSISNGYRAFTAPCVMYQAMLEDFDFYGYELIDRRGKTCNPQQQSGQ